MSSESDSRGMKLLATLILLASFATADDTDKLIDQLFHADQAKRAAARIRILQLDDAVLAKLLDRIEARQKQAERVLQVYSVRDLEATDALWAVARNKLDELDADIHQQGKGNLVVVANARTHAEIAAILTRLRDHAARTITISCAVVDLAEGVKAPRDFAKGALEKWLADHDSKIEKLPNLTCRNGQRVEIAAMRSLSYVADFAVEIAQGTVVADPVIDTVPSGIALHVRALANKEIDLHIDVRSAQVTRPFKEASLRIDGAQPVRIQVPESRSLHVRTARSVESGGATVIDLGGRRILVVQAIAVELER